MQVTHKGNIKIMKFKSLVELIKWAKKNVNNPKTLKEIMKVTW